MKTIFCVCILTILVQDAFAQPKKAEVVSLNGNTIYYEVYGKGEPLFLLHGYTLSSRHWQPFIGDYASNYEVYLVDLQGHGKSGAFKDDLSIRSVAKDVQALIRHLKLEKVYAIGYSYGGDVLFQLASMDPKLVKSMILIGASGIWRARDFPNVTDHLSYKNIGNLKWIHQYHTDENQIRILLDQLPNYDASMSDEEIRGIEAQTLIVLGDKDESVPLETVVRVRKNLPHSFLWIIPNAGHGAHEGNNKSDFVRMSKAFFTDTTFSKASH